MAAPLTPEAQRALAVALYNEAWALAESAERTPDEDRRMLACAFASRLHWQGIGNDQNLAIGDWLVARVASYLGYANLAIDFAAAAHQRAANADVPAWLRASAAEGMARAHAAAGNEAERTRYLAEAAAFLEKTRDPEDRDLIASQVASVPPAREARSAFET